MLCYLDCLQTDQQSSHHRRPNAHLNVYVEVRDCKFLAIGYGMQLELNDIEHCILYVSLIFHMVTVIECIIRQGIEVRTLEENCTYSQQ